MRFVPCLRQWMSRHLAVTMFGMTLKHPCMAHLSSVLPSMLKCPCYHCFHQCPSVLVIVASLKCPRHRCFINAQVPSTLQVAAQNMPMASLIVGVDLVPIKPIRGVKTMLGDITTQVRALVTECINRKDACMRACMHLSPEVCMHKGQGHDWGHHPAGAGTGHACRSGLKKLAGGSSFDVVVHDGAPNVGGAWSHEAYSQ
eukprot:scaffold141548_cov18-Tisochrysis_lutea.AAC.1